MWDGRQSLPMGWMWTARCRCSKFTWQTVLSSFILKILISPANMPTCRYPTVQRIPLPPEKEEYREERVTPSRSQGKKDCSTSEGEPKGLVAGRHPEFCGRRIRLERDIGCIQRMESQRGRDG